MVSVTVYTHKLSRRGFQLTGHAQQGAYGKDIVCSGISAITQSALLGITDVLALKAKVTLKEGDLSCLLQGELTRQEQDKADVVIKTMEAGLKSIRQGYPTALKLSYREV